MVLEFFAYADESGISRGEPYCMIGGFIASPRRWNVFKRAWKEVLDSEGVPAFHAVEFFQQASWQSKNSHYHGWSLERKVSFLSRLLLTLRSRDIRDIGGLVDNNAFFALTDDDRRVATGADMKIHWDFPGGTELEAIQVDDPRVRGGTQARPYPAAFFVLVRQALEHVPDGAKVHFVFHIQNVEEGLARQNYASMVKKKMSGWEKLGGLTYDRAEVHEPLQAADLYTYIVTNWVARDGQVPPENFIAAAELIGRRRRKLQMRDAEAFKRDEQRITEEIAQGIIEQFAHKQYNKKNQE